MSLGNSTNFYNCDLCIAGEFVSGSFAVDSNSIITDLHVDGSPYRTKSNVQVDLGGAILAPGFLELQTNGLLGFHFTHFEKSEQYQNELDRVAKYFVSRGVTGFWATIPTVSRADFQKVVSSQHKQSYFYCDVAQAHLALLMFNLLALLPGDADESSYQILPSLVPQSFEKGASLLGAHVEGPYLAASRKGAHDSSLFQNPESTSPEDLYGFENLRQSVKMVTLAPELPGAIELISKLTGEHQKIVSLGHSAADYDRGMRGVEAGAKTLTHVFNTMNPLHHRQPGLAGLMSSSMIHYSVIPDGIHLHPATLALSYRANPEKCILITDSIEMAGLPDGVYPGHAQIPHMQRKEGNKVTIDGTETLIGSCSTLDECMNNLVRYSGCSVAEAVRCVTENVADLMGEQERGKFEVGRRADFVRLSDDWAGLGDMDRRRESL